MKKTKLSPNELNKVVELRKKKLPWTIIGQITGVERRVAKHEYEEWEEYQKIEKQEYTKGYKSGYRQGYRQGYRDCRREATQHSQ